MMYPSHDTVSVVIPTRDRSDQVLRAVASVANQSRRPHEVILVDDGSEDDTVDRVETLYPDVRVLRQSHQGVSSARNHGVKAATGRWVAFLDSDDEWRPDKLARQLDVIAETPQVVLCHTDETWIRNGRRVNPRRRHAKSGGWIFKACLPLCAISPSSVLMRRVVFEALGGFDEQMPVCEDYDLWLRVCSRHPVHFIGEPLIVKYGGHADQLSRRYYGMDRYRVYALEKILSADILSEADRDAAREMLVEKTNVYLAGARKRKRWDEVADYEAKLRRFSDTREPKGLSCQSSTG